MAILTNVTGTAILNLQFAEVFSTGLITAENLPANVFAPAIPGATIQYTNGNGALTVDMLYGKALTLNATTTTIDLTNLTLIDQTTGNAAGRVREFLLLNPDANANHVVKAYSTASNGVSFLPPIANYLFAPGNNGRIYLNDPNSTGAGNGYYVDSSHKTFTLDTGSNNVTFYLLMVLNSTQ